MTRGNQTTVFLCIALLAAMSTVGIALPYLATYVFK